MKLRCVHLSDVHWRGLTRHEEYIETFRTMFGMVRDLKPNLIFIGGDIVHSKTQGISPELIDCLTWWFNEMSQIAPTHIILGNHDGLILNKDRQDAVSPIVSALKNPRLHLYKQSGVYPTGIPGFNWCVFSCFDEEGWASVKPVPGEVNIATFHGSVKGSKTDSEWMLDSDASVEMFDGFDFTFLGDIHKYQYIDEARRIAYPGSTIQQNYGEDTGKGFIFWEIEDSSTYKSTFYPVPHRQPFITIDWLGDVTSTVSAAMKHPDYTRYRIRTTSVITNGEMKQLFGELKEIKKASEIVFKNDSEQDVSKITISNSQYKPEDLRTLSTHMSLMRDFYTNTKLSDEEWSRLEALTQKYFTAASHGDCIRNIKWSIKRLEFDNMFSYGKGNLINFENLKGITGIFGRNRAGKSSIPGTIMYGLYNATDRGAMSNLHVINMRKGHCETKIDLGANGKYYRLERQSVRKSNKNGTESAVTNLNFYELDESGNVTKDLNGEQRRETEKFLRAVVGTSDDFLLTSLASQGEMNNFVKHKASARKSILTKFLDLEIFEEMYSLAKSDSSSFKSLIASVPDRDWDVLIKEMESERSQSEASVKRLEGEIEILRMKLQKAQIDYATLNQKSLVTAQDVAEKEDELARRRQELEDTSKNHAALQEEVSMMERKVSSIAALKQQFPIADLRSQYDSRLDLERNLMQMKHLLATEKNTIDGHKKSLKLLDEVPCGDSFPTCKFIKTSHQSKTSLLVHEKTASELVDKIAAMKKSLDSLDKESLKEKIDKYNQVLEKERDLQVGLASKQLEVSRVSSRESNLQSLVKDLDHELASMRLRVSDTDEAERASLAKRLVADLTRDINSLDGERLNHAQMIGTLSSKLERTRAEREKHIKILTDWRIYDLFTTAVSKNGIPLKIMSIQLPAINAEISKILQGVSGFTVELEADPDTNEMEIYLNYGDSRRIIECGSGMEKMMASLAIRVALINTTSLPKSDLLIIDEGFGALDDMNVESCTRLLNSLKKWFKSILVISHVDAVKDAVDNVLDITQKDMNARVVYE